jgi:hypothetical protein
MKRNPVSVLLMISACVLCLGQTCAPSASLPGGGGYTVIPAGTYAGQLAGTVKVTLNGVVEKESSADFTFTATFDQDGAIVVPGKGKLAAGESQTLVVGDVTLTITVDSVTNTADGVDVSCFVTAVTEYRGTPVALNGTGQIGYSIASGGNVTAGMTFGTSYNLVLGTILGVRIDATGTLTPQ